jgi:hypothetical protein
MKSKFEMDFKSVLTYFLFLPNVKKKPKDGNIAPVGGNPDSNRDSDFSSGDLEGKRENGLKNTQAICS